MVVPFLFCIGMIPQFFPDAVIDGNNNSTEVNSVTVTAGYFITDPNNKEVRTAIYYVSFNLEKTFYAENGGSENECEAVCNELAVTIQDLINNVELIYLKF